MDTHYDALGIEPGATAAQVKDAYRRAAMRWHPDRNRDNVAEAERRFKAVGAAYAVLSDPERRRHYDEQLRQSQGESEDTGFDAEAAAEMFMREMVEMAMAMATTGYNKDVLFGALLSQGVPETMARDIAARVIEVRAQAQANAAQEQRAKAQRERQAQHQRQANERAAQAEEARQRGSTPPPPTNGGSRNAAIWIGGLFLLLIVAAINSGGKKGAEPTGVNFAQNTSQQSNDVTQQPALGPAQPGHLAIAPRKANIRSGPGTKFPVIALVSRGDSVRPTNKPGTSSFAEIELPDGRKGWIAQELLIDVVAAQVLRGTTPEAYAESSPVRLSQMVSESDLLMFSRAMSTSNAVNQTPSPESLIATLKALAPTSEIPLYPRDVNALRWWTLEGRWLSDNGGTPAEIVTAAIAAVYADPNDAGALVALGMAAMKAGFYGPAFDRVVRALTIAAPESTNTWVLVAASAAHRSQPQVARAALEVALAYSRDVKVTRAFIANVASQSSVPMVAAAFGSMSSEASPVPASPSSSSTPSTAEKGAAPTAAHIAQARPQCSGLSRYSESFDQQMSALVRLTATESHPARYTADQAVFVGRLCASDHSAAQRLVEEGKVSYEFAERARQALNGSLRPFQRLGAGTAGS